MIKIPKHADTFEVCCRQTFDKPSPLSGRQVAVQRKEACTPVGQTLALQYPVWRLHSFYRIYYILTASISEETGKFYDRGDHGFLCVPWLLQPTPTPIDVIYRAKYDRFTGHAKTLTGKCMTFNHIQTHHLGALHVIWNVLAILNNTGVKGSSLQPPPPSAGTSPMSYSFTRKYKY